MKQLKFLVILMLATLVGKAQAPSNYTNINGRYRWIAGMFDSTFHIPKGTTPSLRTGGSTNAGALFYRTSDSTVRYWTGTQWLTLSDTTRFVPYVGAIQDVDLNSWSLNAKSLHVKGTAGNGHLGLRFQSATPNMSANETGLYSNANGDLGVKIDNAYTSIFKTHLNSADRTYTFQNKSYTVADSADVEGKIGGTLISGYLTKATGTKTIDTSQIYQTDGRIGVGTITPTGKLQVDKTDGIGMYLNFNTVSGSGTGTTALYAINNTNSSGYAAVIEEKTPNTTAGQYPFVIKHSLSSGTAGTGFGTGVHFQLLDDAGTVKTTQLTIENIDAAAATYKTRYRFNVQNNGTGTAIAYINPTGLGLGTATYDSMLTVAQGAYFQRGVRMSALPTGVGTKALRIDATGNVSVADTLTNGVSGSLTTDFIPKATGTSTLGNSPLSVGAGVVGLGLGVVPPNAWTNYWALQLANGVALGSYNFSNIPIGWLGTNAYHDGMGDIRVSNGAANKYLQDRGNHKWFVAGSGTAGSYISFTQAMTLDSSNRLSIGTTTMDSMFKVAQGAYFQRGVRMSGLPTGAGTKALRIDASGTISIADTLIDAGGTVTSVATNNGTGITGGTITTTGTIAADTLLLSTRAWRQKGIDSVAALINTNVSGTTNYVSKFTGTNTIGNSQIFDNGTNVGIGTASPAYKLDVVNAGTLGIRMQNTSNTSDAYLTTQNTLGSTLFGINATGGYIYNGTALPILFYTSGNERMRLDASGNLGIGTSSPSVKLQVDNNTHNYFQLNSTVANVQTSISAQNTASGNRATLSWEDGTRGAYGDLYSSTFLSFSTGAGEKARLTNAGELLINTTTDVGDYKLQVSGNVYASGSGTFGSSVTATIFDATSNAYRFNGNNALSLVSLGGQSVVKINAAGYWGTQLVGANDQGILINNTGNVGIGTTSPSAKLHTLALGTPITAGVGTVAVFQRNEFNYNGANVSIIGGNVGSSTINFGDIDSETIGQISYDHNVNAMLFQTNSAERMRITSGGNVGIGTSSPTGYTGANLVLHLHTSNTITDLKLTNGTTGSTALTGGLLRQDGRAMYLWNIENSFLSFGTNNGESMRIFSNGNVAIGTTTDAGYKLDVNGTGRFSGQLTVLASSSSTAGLVVRGGSSIGTPATASGQILIGQTTTYRGSIAYDDNTGYMYIDNLYDNANSNIYIRTKTSGTPVNALTIVGSGAATFSSSVTAQQGLSVSGNGALTNSANKFILDFYNGNSRLYSLGTNTSTKGGYEFHTNSSDGSLDVVALSIASTGAATFSSSITTGAPSGGTAGAWKLGSRVASAGVTFNDQQYIQLDIGGTLYYLATVDLPMPEAYPQATSGPSNNYKITPVQVKTTKDVEIEKLRKELDELKQIIKNLNK